MRPFLRCGCSTNTRAGLTSHASHSTAGLGLGLRRAAAHHPFGLGRRFLRARSSPPITPTRHAKSAPLRRSYANECTKKRPEKLEHYQPLRLLVD